VRKLKLICGAGGRECLWTTALSKSRCIFFQPLLLPWSRINQKL